MNKATHKDLILRHMKSGSITTFAAFKRYRITRLSERVREIEGDGYLVNRTPIVRDGKRYVAYSLVEGCKRRAA